MSAAPPERIVTAHLELCRLRREDEAELVAVTSSNAERLALWMHWAVGWTPASTAEFLPFARKQWDDGTEFAWLVRHAGAVVGGAAFERRDDVCEVGYWLAETATGQGFATEASRALTTAAFGLPGVDTVEIWHDAANAASGGIPRRLGFREVDRLDPSRLPPIGRRVGIDVVHQMRRADWRP